ncbi:hypothetical protein [Neolewinella sp.]|uniref:hypothetical protein n=1 Tax=Neolewinella sp. TaxID=2993543 RepID=UPI003B530578
MIEYIIKAILSQTAIVAFLNAGGDLGLVHNYVQNDDTFTQVSNHTALWNHANHKLGGLDICDSTILVTLQQKPKKLIIGFEASAKTLYDSIAQEFSRSYGLPIEVNASELGSISYVSDNYEHHLGIVFIGASVKTDSTYLFSLQVELR